MATRLKVVLTLEDVPAYVVAGVAGVNASTLSRYVNGRMPIKERHLSRLAAFFDVDPDDLRGDADEDWAMELLSRK